MGGCGAAVRPPPKPEPADDCAAFPSQAVPLFYARNLESRGCPPLYRIVLEHCLGWSVLALVLAAASSHGHLLRDLLCERCDLLRARARGLTPVGNAAAADE